MFALKIHRLINYDIKYYMQMERLFRYHLALHDKRHHNTERCSIPENKTPGNGNKHINISS